MSDVKVSICDVNDNMTGKFVEFDNSMESYKRSAIENQKAVQKQFEKMF